MWIKEEAKTIPISASYDVAIVGGGIAGVAAAIAAARIGSKTVLIEKTCSLGGLATLANIIIYLPLCDGCGNQIIKGIGEELLKLSIKDGYNKIPSCWMPGGNTKDRIKSRYLVKFNPASFMLNLEELLLKEGVTIYYDTRFCSVTKRNTHLTSVIVENKDGRSAIRAKTFVDASGDADLCFHAEEPTVSLSTNSLAAWYFYQENNKLKLSYLHRPFDPQGLSMPDGGTGYRGDTAADVTQHIIASRNLIRHDIAQLKNSSTKNIYPITIPSIPSFRMTRRLKGIIELEEADEHTCFEDSIGMTGDWRKTGPIYYIPFRSLIGNTPNLITAGRCISAKTAWDIMRAIPTCAVTGEAAGTASALMVRDKINDFSKLDIKSLQKQLSRQKVLLKKRIAKPNNGK